jgi:hypothetical protein
MHMRAHTHTHVYVCIFMCVCVCVCVGVQYKDVKVGSGETPEKGDRVVYDWEGFTIGNTNINIITNINNDNYDNNHTKRGSRRR